MKTSAFAPIIGHIEMVSVVIASYRRPAELSRCVESIRIAAIHSNVPVEIIVSASGYEPLEVEELIASGARVIQAQSRVLVSAARNRGALVAKGEYLLFVDDDNVIAPDSITPLVKCLNEHPELAIVGPVTFYASDPTRIWCAGITRSRIIGRTIFRTHLPEPVPALLPSDDYPNCFMVRTRQFEAVGGFDEELFPMHYEEADLASRLRNARLGSCACVTASKVWHLTRTRFAGRLQLYDPDRAYVSARARAVFVARHQSSVAWISYAVLGQFLFGAGYIAAAFISSGFPRWQIVKSYFRGAFDGLRTGRRLRRLRTR